MTTHIGFSDETCDAAWDAYSTARDDGRDEPVDVMRAALAGASPYMLDEIIELLWDGNIITSLQAAEIRQHFGHAVASSEEQANG